MVSFGERLAEDRRRKVLELLNEGGNRAPETSIKQGLRHIFDDGIARDEVRQYLLYLEQHWLVRIERMKSSDGELWVADLTEAGQSVARGRVHVGIAMRDAV